MRPLSITLSGFRSFRLEQTVDFRGLGLFAIVGDTGAGKSSILEAMVYALFNATTWSERDVKALIALDAPTMRVDFAFEAGGKTYRVTRSASRIARPAVHALRCDQLPEYRIDGESALRTELHRLIGLDYQTFTKTVVLPQGKFAELLTAKEADRTRALTELLGLDAIDRIREALERPRDAARSAASALQAKREELGLDPAAAAAALRAGLSAECRRGDALAATQRAVNAARAERTATEERLERGDARRAARERIDGGLARILAVAPRERELRLARSEAERRLAATEHVLVEKRRAGDEAEARGIALLPLATTRAALERLVRERDRLAREAAELARERDDLREHERERERCEALLATLGPQRDEATAAAATAEAALEAARSEERALSEAWRATVAATERDRERRRAVSVAEQEHAEAAHACAVVREGRDAAAGQHAQALRALDEACREHRVAALTRGLAGGDPCPVCAQRLPAAFQPVEAHDLDRAEAAEQRARAALEAAATALEATERRRIAAEATLRAARAELAAVAEGLAVARGGLAALGVSAEARIEDVLQTAQAAGAAAALAAAAGRERADACAREVAATLATVTALRDRLASDAARVNRHGERWTEAAARLETERAAVPERLRPSRALEDAEIAGALSALEADEAEARRYAAETEAAQRECRDAERELASLQATYASEVAAVIVERLSAIDAELRALDDEPDAGPEVGGAPAVGAPVSTTPTPVGQALSGEFDEVFRWASHARELGVAALASLHGARTELVAAREAAERNLAAALLAAGLDDIAALEGAVAAVGERRAVLDEKLRVADEAVVAAADLDARLAVVEPLVAAIERLRTYLQQNAFKKYVMARRERRLLAAATETLRAMTGGRYAFGEGFAILDGQTGQARSPETLSGGEKFLASLALALGLVELAASAGGRLDALFLDEGFGSLDGAALDAALAELARRASGGKLIGVITHVRGIAGEIDDVLRVRRLPGGSEVERLDAGARERFFENAVGAGLLEAVG